MGLAMASVGAMMSAFQIAAISKAKPVRGYEKGYYGTGLFDVIREQDGKTFQAGYGGQAQTGLVKKPTVFLAGENGVEMIIDNKTFRNFTPELKYDLAMQTPTMKGYERGYYQDKTSSTASEGTAELLQQNLLLLQQNAVLMNQLTENGIRAYVVMDFPTMRKIKKVEEDYTNHQNANRL